MKKSKPTQRRFQFRYLILLFFSATACCAQRSKPNIQNSYHAVIIKIQNEIESHHLSRAKSSLTNALGEYPNDGGIENLLGIVEAEQGDIQLAQHEFTLAIQNDPKLTSAYLNLGRLIMQSTPIDASERQEAIDLYRVALKQSPNNEEAAYNLAFLLMWQRQYQNSIKALQTLPAKSRHNIQIEAVDCADLAALGERSNEQSCIQNLEANPTLSDQTIMLLLPILREQHQAKTLASLLTAERQYHPLSLTSLRLLGLAQEAEGKLIQAQNTLQHVYQRDPTWVVPLIDLTRISLEQKHNISALGYLAHAKSLKPNDANLAYEYGIICLKLGLLNETIKAIQDAVELAPNNPQYNLSMGIIASYGANPSTAIPYLMKYHSLRPKDPKGLLALGSGLFRDERYKDALKWLTMAKSFPATRPRALYYTARILNAEGKYRLAVKELVEASQLKADQADVYAELGKSFIHLKDFKDATNSIHQSLAIDPNNYAGNLALLQLYSHTHDGRIKLQLARFLAVKKAKQNSYLESLRTLSAEPVLELQTN